MLPKSQVLVTPEVTCSSDTFMGSPVATHDLHIILFVVVVVALRSQVDVLDHPLQLLQLAFRLTVILDLFLVGGGCRIAVMDKSAFIAQSAHACPAELTRRVGRRLVTLWQDKVRIDDMREVAGIA